MNPRLDLLHPYPFEKLRLLMAGVTPPAGLAHINLSIGEPQHATPKLLTAHPDLVLQLHFSSDVGCLSGSLMGSAPA